MCPNIPLNNLRERETNKMFIQPLQIELFLNSEVSLQVLTVFEIFGTTIIIMVMGNHYKCVIWLVLVIDDKVVSFNNSLLSTLPTCQIHSQC